MINTSLFLYFWVILLNVIVILALIFISRQIIKRLQLIVDTNNKNPSSQSTPSSIKIDASSLNNLPSLKNIETMVWEIFIGTKFTNKDAVWSLLEISIEIWKIEKKFRKTQASNPEDTTLRWVEISIGKIKSLLDVNEIKLLDYTGQKYIEGMNGIEVVSHEKDSSTTFDVIQETLEPWIELCGKLHKKAKVIVLSPL